MADESRVFPENTGDPLRAPGEWLDEATAEGLLSGVSPDALLDDNAAPEPRSAAEMARLVQVLSALRALAGDTGATGFVPGALPSAGATGTAGMLPGEAGALAAFRQARDGASHGAAANALPPRIPQQQDGGRSAGDLPPLEIGSVHLAGGPGGPDRTGDGATRADRFRWRPLRFGLAATLAGCMLGGAAAVTGLLPSPVGGLGRPGPAVSVSGDGTPEAGRSAGASGGGTPQSPGARGSDGSGSPSGRPGDGSGGHGHGRQTHGNGQKNGDPGTAENWWTQMVSACQDYRGGKTLDDKRAHELEKAANGSERVGRFCEGLLADQDAPGNHGGDSGNGTGGNDGTSGNNGVGNSDDQGQQQSPGTGGETKDSNGSSADHDISASPSASDDAPSPSDSPPAPPKPPASS